MLKLVVSKARSLCLRVAQFLRSRLAAAGAAIRRLLQPVGNVYRGLARARRRLQLRAIALSGEPVTLFLAPEAGLKPFFASHAILARTLAEAGHPAIVLSCDGLMPACTVKSAMRMEPTAPGDDRNPACRQCRVVALAAGHDYGLVDISLESLLEREDRAVIAATITAFGDAPESIMFDGIEIGALCVAEVTRSRRRLSFGEFTPEDIALLKALAFSTLAVYLALQKLVARFKLVRIVYFGDYAYNISAQIFAIRHRIRLVNITHAYHRDVDRRLISFRPSHAWTHMRQQYGAWDTYRDRPLPANAVASIADGALYRFTGFGGASTYSPNWKPGDDSILAEFGLSSGRRTLVAYPSSSDETICVDEQMRVLGVPPQVRQQPFPGQDEWLEALVRWVADRSDLQLIVRLHPRMGVGHRHAALSSDYAKMKGLFASVPRNVAVVWPESSLSSYNIAEVADVALVSWSSMGLELARLGVPVVASFAGLGDFPTGRVVAFNGTPSGYFEAVLAACEQPAALGRIAEAFRWTYFQHWGTLIDVSDVVTAADYGEIPPYHTPRQRDELLDVVVNGADVIAKRMGSLPRTRSAYMTENAAVLEAIRRFVYFLVSGRDALPQKGLRVVAGDRPSSSHPVAADATPTLYIRPDGVSTLIDIAGRHQSASIMVARLAKLLVAAPTDLGLELAR